MAKALAVFLVVVGLLAPSTVAAADEQLAPNDYPDPSLLNVGGTYFAYATNGGGRNVQVMSSLDLHTWQRMSDALPQLPSWAAPNFTWAPEVLAFGPNRFVLYYTARHRSSGLQCIGRAVGTMPQGPFTDELSQPFVCQMDRRGSIDPSPFRDADGRSYLLYKSEGTVGEPTRIWSQPLSADGSALAGPPVQIAVTDQAWEEPLIEGPTMTFAGGSYWLFYAGNHWETARYAIGVARCASALGPCTKDGRGPVLSSAGAMAGPGSPGVVAGPNGTTLLTYHAWSSSRVGYPGGARSLRATPLAFAGGRPVLGGGVGPASEGYRLVASDGGVFAFGDAGYFGSTGAIRLNKPIVGMAPTGTGLGYWLVASDGGVFSFGDAGYFGSTGAMRLNNPIVAMVATPTDLGYWLVASDGGVFSFGDAGYFGSTGAVRLNKPIVGMAATATGRGYWLVASDGGVFAFGDAGYFGSTGNIELRSPIVAMAAMPWGDGYWLMAADGGVFAFGAAPFLGSAGGLTLSSPIVHGGAAPGGDGYWLVGSDGGVFAFGPGAPFHGSTGGMSLTKPVVGIGA
jgi:hypothetical protein